MKKNTLLLFCFLLLFCGSFKIAHAQQKGKTLQDNNKPKGEPINIYYEEERNWKDKTWKRNGFEFYIGGGIYFGSKKTANYYNGAPENDINLNLLFNNEYYWRDIINILRQKYPYTDTMIFKEGYNYDSRYNIAMDISLGAKYRFNENWYIELSYSFRRLTCENRFNFDFPGGVPGNKENPPYSKWEYLLAKEDRHYIDFSVGYIFQKHPIAKPFIAIGGMFTYVNIKSFLVFIENTKPTFDLMAIAKNPNYIPGVQSMPNYRVWSGPGYGCSLTVGLKIAVNRMVSLDPLFQLSAASFGNSQDLPGFNTKMCFNYMGGVRLVMNDALFTRKKD